MENEVKLKIEEWELLVQVKILDPDGFDRTNPNLFNEKFTYKEFKKGMDESTQKSMTHEEWTSQYERLHNSNKHEPQVKQLLADRVKIYATDTTTELEEWLNAHIPYKLIRFDCSANNNTPTGQLFTAIISKQSV